MKIPKPAIQQQKRTKSGEKRQQKIKNEVISSNKKILQVSLKWPKHLAHTELSKHT